MKRLAGVLGAAVLAAGLAVAAHAEDKLRIVVITHGQAASAFWSVAKNGVVQAQKDLPGVTIEYRAPETFDMVAMKQIIDPERAHCRTDEYALFQDEGFLAWFAGLGLERIGFREIRTVLRRRQALARSAE